MKCDVKGTDGMTEAPTMKKRRLYGFQGMSPERRREIASKGGKRSHELKRAHRWTPEEAAIAGRKGGLISRKRSRYAVSSEVA